MLTSPLAEHDDSRTARRRCQLEIGWRKPVAPPSTSVSRCNRYPRCARELMTCCTLCPPVRDGAKSIHSVMQLDIAKLDYEGPVHACVCIVSDWGG